MSIPPIGGGTDVLGGFCISQPLAGCRESPCIDLWYVNGFDTNLLIAASRSTIIANVGDCTRPTAKVDPYKQEKSRVALMPTN